MSYDWDTWLEPQEWDKILTEGFDQTYEDFQTAAQLWAESENIKNHSIGEARAVQELAFRDAIISVKSEKVGKSERFFWITVNPRPGTTLPELMKVQEKMISKKWIQSYAYVYENTDKGHIHTHTLIKAEYEPARARKELASTAKAICDVANVHIFKFVILDIEAAKQKLDYMLGKKQPKKLDNVELTKQWRKDNDLKEIYFFNNEGLNILLDPRKQ